MFPRAKAAYRNTANRSPNTAIVNSLAMHPTVDPPVKSGATLIVVSVGSSCRVGLELAEAVVLRLALATLERARESVALVVLVPEKIVTVVLVVA